MSRPRDPTRMSHRHARRRLATACVAAALLAPIVMSQAADPSPWAALGRPPTPAELKAWDIDVRSDFKGLPAGSGSVAQGQTLWEAKCATCHGIFGESNDVFTPIVGGTTTKDIETGRVESLIRPNQPHRTTMMRLSHLSSLWDYIHRAMPWNAPKSLSADDVYALTAYILSLADVVQDDFTLSDRNIAEVQARLPNRDGKRIYRPMWDAAGRGDTANPACMSNCPVKGSVTSAYPHAELGSHGNLVEQNRLIGPVRGIDLPMTGLPAGTPPTR